MKLPYIFKDSRVYSLNMITINASEVAALVGRNPYKDAEEAIQDLINRNVHHTPDQETQRALEICQDDPGAKRLHQDLMTRSRLTRNTEEASKVKEDYHSAVSKLEEDKIKGLASKQAEQETHVRGEFEPRIRDATTRSQKNKVLVELGDEIAAVGTRIKQEEAKVHGDMEHLKKVGTRKANTSFGTRHEASVGDMYHAQTGLNIDKDNIRRFWEFMPGFGIVGRFDGFNEAGVLVEIKNRMRRLFGKVVEYELVQVHVYMAMSRKTQAQLVERYQDEILIHPVEFEQEFMDDVMKELRDICKSYF